MDHQASSKINLISLIYYLSIYHHPLADWNFFATSHGKGENDGVGGGVKNAVWHKTLQM